jgi:hypothetical protein
MTTTKRRFASLNMTNTNMPNTINKFFLKVVFLSLAIILLAGNFASATTNKVDRATAPLAELVKMPGNNAVYYKAVNGARYIFPNEKTFKTWYADFSSVKTITAEEMYALPIGGNVTYKPNSRLIKITTDPKVYWVAKNGVLRWLTSETLAKQMFGNNWSALVDDLPDAFFAPPTYTIGEALTENNRPCIEKGWAIYDNLELFFPGGSANDNSGNNNPPPPPTAVDATEQPANINLTAWVVNQNVNLSWAVSGGNTKYGFAIVKSTNQNPVYPADTYVKINYADTATYTWENFDNNTFWYFRVCRINSDNTCTVYSDNVSMAIGVTEKIPGIVLSGTADGTTAKLSWQTNWLSANNGFYLIRGYNENPKYGQDIAIWLDKTKESYNWEGLSFNTYHFRICRYAGTASNLCDYYSNDAQLIIQ